MIKLHKDIHIKAKTIGEFIGMERTRSGWTQRQLGYFSGTSKSTVAHIEVGHHIGTLAIMESLLEALGYDLLIVPSDSTTKQITNKKPTKGGPHEQD